MKGSGVGASAVQRKGGVSWWVGRPGIVCVVGLPEEEEARLRRREALERAISPARAQNACDGLGGSAGGPLPGPALELRYAEAALLRSQLSRAALSSTWSAAKHKQAVTAAQVAGPLGLGVK